MDKDRPRHVMRARYRDVGKGEKIRHKIAYGELTTSLQTRIGPDLTEHELLEHIILTLKRINTQLAKVTDEDITEDDIRCP